MRTTGRWGGLSGALALGTWLALSTAAAFPAEAPGEAEEAMGTRLERPHREFLEEVAPLLSEAERRAFLELAKDYQRSAFIERFWRVRDPYPETARNELREAWRQRAEVARSRFDDLRRPRPRALLLYGEPERTTPVRCDPLLKHLEVWSYAGGFAGPGEFHLVFIREGGERYRLWSPHEGVSPLLGDLVRLDATDTEIARRIAQECFRGDQLLTALERTIDPEAEVVPHPGEEWLQTFVSTSTELPEGAETFPGKLALRFPARHQSRTVVQGVVTVVSGELTGGQEATEDLHLVLDGEVVRDGELFESFRYRFQFPRRTLDGPDTPLPMVFERYLRPGEYTLIVRARDLETDRYFRTERALDVPAVSPTRPAGTGVQVAGAPAEAAAAPAAAETATTPLDEANAALPSGDQSLRLLPPTPGLLVGVTRVEALTRGDGIARVRFLLDGRRVMSKRRPPYSVELQLGEAPQIHRVTAIAVDEEGEELARDELVLNAGPHRFAVRLVEPRRGGRYQSSLRASAEVEVPEGESLDRVEFYLNDDRISTLYQPPFVQPVVIPQGLEIAYVRAVAYLDDGNSTEDLVFVNAPEYLEEVDVQFVELYTTVLDRRGRPVDGLTGEDFKVTEDGVEQVIRRFERVDDLPVYAGLVLDTSASMAEELREVVKAALRFFETVITPKDRAAVVTFSDHHDLAVRFTNNSEVLAGGVAGLTAEGETALYDSLIYALYYFSGIKGKRAILLISDGEDVNSHYDFEDVLTYARRTGVAVYTIGLGIPPSQKEIQIKLRRLAEETGGRNFQIDRSRALARVYEAIEAELRSQYLIAYQSSQQEGDEAFRSVEVEVSQPGAEAKTIRGYYP